MTDQEINQRVAVEVMGWAWHTDAADRRNPEGERVYHFAAPHYLAPSFWKQPTQIEGEPPPQKPGRVHHVCYGPPNYTTDIAADYSVLVKVRETWDSEATGRFVDALIALWHFPTPIQYRPGDYSKAALKALSPQEGQGAKP